ncbi:hypothetical protein NIES25_29890 [Nostoc linckia NIES-25]|nr:hypothetical protein NIES25_29890 [Nostoc linckia NIES-25]
MIKNIKSLKKLFILSGLSGVLSAYVLGTGFTLLPSSINSSALAENPNNLQVDFPEFGSTMNYDRAKGTCTVISKSRELAQTIYCRNSWTQIAYAGRRIIFYDRNAREIEIHVVNPPDGTIGSTLTKYGPAQKVRGTWATITHIGNGVFRFTDDNGKFWDYTISAKDFNLVPVRK